MLGSAIVSLLSLLAGEGLPPDPAAAQTWTLTHPLAEYEDHFGRGTAVLDGLVYGGAPEAGSGRVFRWQRQGSRWMLAGEVIPADPTMLGYFGAEIDADGSWVAVAAPPGNNLDGGGAVVMFEVVDGGLVERTVIAPLGDSVGDYFGTVVDLDGETIVVWRYDEPEVYVFDGATWVFEASIVPSVPIESAVGSLALDGDTLVVGDPFANVGKYEDCGVATIFAREAGTWTEQGSFPPESPGFDSRFATGVGLEGDVAVMVRGYMGNWIEVYERSGDAWTRTASFQPEIGGSNFFGDRVRLDGGRLIVADGGSLGTSGTTVMFRRDGDAWPVAWVGPDSYAIGIEGDILTLGRPVAGEDERGEVVVVELTGAQIGEPCQEDADCLFGFCVDGVCCDDYCMGTCDACSVAAGAEQDGTCFELPAPGCCSDSVQCVDEDPCTAETCTEGVCTYEDACCESHDECVSADPCLAGICQATGFCDYVPLDGCAAETGATSSAGSVSDDGSDTDAGASGASTGDGGCGCSHQNDGCFAAALLVLVLLGVRRRAACSRRHSVLS